MIGDGHGPMTCAEASLLKANVETATKSAAANRRFMSGILLSSCLAEQAHPKMRLLVCLVVAVDVGAHVAGRIYFKQLGEDLILDHELLKVRHCHSAVDLDVGAKVC